MSDKEEATSTKKAVAEQRKEKTFWNNPKVERQDGEIVGVEFRDGYIELEDAKVIAYVDKDRGVTLVPTEPDVDGRVYIWNVLDGDEQPTGATWRGSIEFVSNAVVIEQVHNGLRRTYISDGSVETEYRTSRVTEIPGRRKTVFRNGTKIEENFNDDSIVITYDDRVVTRLSDGSSVTEFTDGSDVEIEANIDGQIVRISDQNGYCELGWDEDGRIGSVRYV